MALWQAVRFYFSRPNANEPQPKKEKPRYADFCESRGFKSSFYPQDLLDPNTENLCFLLHKFDLQWNNVGKPEHKSSLDTDQHRLTRILHLRESVKICVQENLCFCKNLIRNGINSSAYYLLRATRLKHGATCAIKPVCIKQRPTSNFKRPARSVRAREKT
jgi:hypothetical protein